ncbi:MAG: hypothetical protein IKY83_00655 [Proteobacteria bacterium]|nr:hypothetical protein [Pseudomonadota bacterium]
MTNPFRKASFLKRLFSLVILITFSLSFSPVAMAQDFDFSDDADDVGAGDFNFDDGPSQPLNVGKTFVMPQNGKPVNLVIFEPVDGTPQKTLDQLTEATVEKLQDEKYAEYDSVEGIPITERLNAMSEDDRANCTFEASCIADLGREIGAANVIVGRITTEGVERPKITFDLIDVNASSSKNYIEFETQNRLRKQEQDIAGALLRLFNIDTGSIDSLMTKRVVEESAPLPTGQLVGGIIVGVLALGAVGAGAYFGYTAKQLDDQIEKDIEANLDATPGSFDSLKHQAEVKADQDAASKDAMIANILYASGAVLAVVSVILFLVRQDKDEDIFANDLYISPSIGTDGGGIVTGFTF